MATTTVPDVRTATMTDSPPRPDLVVGDDGHARCWWGAGDPLYVTYHDDEWGRPLRDEHALFGLLCLEFFQSGLSWLTILRKRPAFFAAFDGFDPEVVAGYGEAEVARLMGDAGIVRNRMKIDAAIANAQALTAMHAQGETLVDLLFSFAPEAGSPERPAGRFLTLAEVPVEHRRRPRRWPRRSRPAGSASSARSWPTHSCSRPASSTTTSRGAGSRPERHTGSPAGRRRTRPRRANGRGGRAP